MQEFQTSEHVQVFATNVKLKCAALDRDDVTDEQTRLFFHRALSRVKQHQSLIAKSILELYYT